MQSFDLKHHFVWIPKYRKQLQVGEVAEATRETLPRIPEAYEMEIDTMEVAENHVNIFLTALPRYSPAWIM